MAQHCSPEISADAGSDGAAKRLPLSRIQFLCEIILDASRMDIFGVNVPHRSLLFIASGSCFPYDLEAEFPFAMHLFE